MSKAALFQHWSALMKKLQRDSTAPGIYCDAKHLAIDYQLAKTEVNKAFQKGGFGLWIVGFSLVGVRSAHSCTSRSNPTSKTSSIVPRSMSHPPVKLINPFRPRSKLIVTVFVCDNSRVHWYTLVVCFSCRFVFWFLI